MNLVIFSGKLANVFDNVNNVRFTIAEKYKNSTQFVTFTAFNNTANFIRNYINIGDHISIEGRIDTYKNNVGKEVISLIANSVNFEGYQRKNEQKPDTADQAFSNEALKNEIECTENWDDIVNITNKIVQEDLPL